MTFPRSHDRRRLEGARLREVAQPDPAAVAPTKDAKRPNRAARRKLSAPLRARIARGVGSTLDGHASPQAGAQVASQALSLYRSGQRELGTSSPIALSHLLRFAIGTAVAQHLALKAADLGAETPAGRELLDLALRVEGRAERASVAALSFARALGGRRAGGERAAPWLEDGSDDDGGGP